MALSVRETSDEIDRRRGAPWLRARLVGALLLAAGCTAYPEHDPNVIAVRQRFVSLGNGTVRDDATGLVWTGDANLAQFTDPWDGYTWPEALRFVTAMNRGERANFGRTDWRLPRAEELGELLAAFTRPANASEVRARAFWSALVGPISTEMWSDTRHVTVDAFSNVRETAYWSGTAAPGDLSTRTLGPYTPDASAAEIPSSSRVWAVDTEGFPLALDSAARKGVWPVSGTFTPPTPP